MTLIIRLKIWQYTQIEKGSVKGFHPDTGPKIAGFNTFYGIAFKLNPFLNLFLPSKMPVTSNYEFLFN
jgi:hypothetical protein